MKHWIGWVKNLLGTLIPALHLGTGAHKQGKEIGYLWIHSKASKRLDIFFVCTKVLTVLTKKDMSDEKWWNVTCFPILGHGDFISLQRIITLIGFEMYYRTIHGTVGGGNINMSKIQDSISMGLLETGKVTENICKHFSKFAIPFKFSAHRHWQREFGIFVSKIILHR